MSMTRNPVARDVLNQIVMDPQYPDVMHVPVFSIPQIVLAGGALALFGASTAGYMTGQFPLLAAMFCNLIAVYLAFTPLHDASHRAVSSNGFLNDLIGVVTGQLLLPGINMTAFRTIHMDHHRYVGQEGRDPDTAFVKPPRPFGLFYLMFADVHWAIWYVRYGRHLWSRKAGAYILLLLVMLVASHAAFLLSPWWKEFLLLYVVPQRLGLGVVAYTFAHIQHPHGLTWDNEPFQSTLYVRGNSPFRRLMFGQEEHIIHHLTPHIPWFKYKRVWDLANGVLRKQGIPGRGWFEGPGEFLIPSSDDRLPIAMRVTAVTADVPGVRSITLEPINGIALGKADAGAHIDLHLPGNLVRQYSLVEANDRHFRIAVRLDLSGRGGSKAVHQLKAGDTLLVGRPRNNFVLYETGTRFILIAGGIGVTPMVSMARRLTELGKPFELHLCARDAATAPLWKELQASNFAGHCYLHPDKEDGSSSLDAKSLLSNPDTLSMIYLCGPQGFMDSLRQQAMAAGWHKSQIRTENFSAAVAEESEQEPFTVRLSASKRDVEVGADESIIDALARVGIDVPFACMQGTCGTCITPVTEGEIAHRDAYLGEEDKARMDRMCLCVSRAKAQSISIDL